MISNLNPTHGAHLARKWSCVWRPDVGSRLYARGSWQAAGGVGGLAWLQTGLAQIVAMFSYQEVSGNAEVHIPMMDHMGNVRHYYQIKATGPGASASYVTGQVTANLEYDAFGREVRATGTKTPASGQPPGLAPGEPWVDVLPFHFSTKFTDRESGLNYYGYRFYDSVDGRWVNRDPIGINGGLNLYGMVGNDAVNQWDLLGLQCPPAGFAMDGDNAGQTTLFRQMSGAGGANPSLYGTGRNGADLMNHLQSLTQQCCCIKDLRLAGHGGANGMGGADEGRTGFYREGPDTTGLGPNHPSQKSRNLGDLRSAISSGGIQFCPDCVIKIHACYQSDETIRELAAATGCRVIAGDGQCAPNKNDQDRRGNDSRNSRWRNDDGWRQSNGGAPVEPLPGGNLLNPSTGGIQP